MVHLIWKQVWRLIILVVGGAVLIVGIIMIVAPGPAFIVIPMGIAILATEFPWAKRWLHAMRDRALRAYRAVQRYRNIRAARRWSFEKTSREKVADTALADKLHSATATSLAKTQAIVADTPNWQELRRRAREIKRHTLTHLDHYLRRFITAAEANGAAVSWADTGDDACRLVVELARQRGVRQIVKAKSMTGEEIELNQALAEAGIEPVETDLGEMICQLGGEPPSHITAPVIHRSMEEIARLFKERGVIERIPPELDEEATPRPRPGALDEEATPRPRPGALDEEATPRPRPGALDEEATSRPRPGALDEEATPRPRPGALDEEAIPRPRPETLNALRLKAMDHHRRAEIAAELTAAARRYLREKFLSAEMGVTGANFAVAESGTIVLVENEANIRLSTTLPKLHVAIVGLEKLIPTLADLGTFLSLLPVAATGQRQSGYVSLIHRPYNELHIILLDNGRTRLLADPQHYDLLSCIRCGACLNVCPVYRHVSGHGYNSVYPGPIGSVLMPHLRDGRQYRQLPFASSLCGACTEICPVGIPLHERLLEWRDRIVRDGGRPKTEALAFAVWAWLMQHPRVYRGARPPADWLETCAGLMGPGRCWKETRELPKIAEETFAEWWEKHGQRFGAQPLSAVERSERYDADAEH
jgi:uncharacterized protein (TIGR02611 family)